MSSSSLPTSLPATDEVAGVLLLKLILPAFSAWIGQPYRFDMTPLTVSAIDSGFYGADGKTTIDSAEDGAYYPLYPLPVPVD